MVHTNIYCQRFFSILIAAGLTLAAAAAAAAAASIQTETVYTPVLVKNMHKPLRYKGTDGKYHLVYELLLTNAAKFKSKITKLEVLDGTDSNRVLNTLSAKDLDTAITSVCQPQVSASLLSGSQSAIAWIFLDFDKETDLPTNLRHRLTVEPKAPETAILKRSIAWTTDALSVDFSPVQKLGAPLEGKNWVAANGPSPASIHRHAMLPLNGGLELTQRFAIDWMQLDENGLFVKGDDKVPENYTCYDKKVIAAGDGLVVESVDKFQNQVPGKVRPIPVEEIAGNHLIVDFGENHCALYAHLKPGSVRVKVGDRVKKGQELGRVGNTGNTDAPHLHFHLMEGHEPLLGSGVPYYIDSFNLHGKIESLENLFQAMQKQRKPEIVKASDPLRKEQLPDDMSVVDFD